MPKISTNVRNDLAAIYALLDSLELYSGTIPSTGQTAPTGTLLVSWTGTPLSWGAPSSGLTAIAGVPLTSDAAVASNTAGYARLFNSSDPTISMYCTVGTVSGEVRLSSLVVVSTSTVDLSSCALTMPAT